MAEFDTHRLQSYRLGRLRAELAARDYAACLLVDPINVRYATGSRNMQIWTLRNPARYAFVATEGPVVMFEFAGCEHLLEDLAHIDEIRTAKSFFFFTSGGRAPERANAWAAEIADLVSRHGGTNRRIAVDKVDPLGHTALLEAGLEVLDAQEVAERARSVKSADELWGLRNALRVCERAFDRLQERLEPGVTENEVWATLGSTNAALGGEYIETRLLSSGPRTNPWFRESSDREIRAGELVAVDADMIGPHGFFADLSRTFLCGDGQPTGEQKSLYALAHEQIEHNLATIAPGVSFRELSERSWALPERFVKNRYMSVLHGAGLCGEYPYIPYARDFPAKGYDGVLEENMTLCVESYLGAEDGREGVKLEQLVHVSASGALPLSDYPFESRLLE